MPQAPKRWRITSTPDIESNGIGGALSRGVELSALVVVPMHGKHADREFLIHLRIEDRPNGFANTQRVEVSFENVANEVAPLVDHLVLVARDKDLGLTDEDVEYLLKRYRELADKPMFNLVSEQDEGYTPDLSPKCVPFKTGAA